MRDYHWNCQAGQLCGAAMHQKPLATSFMKIHYNASYSNKQTNVGVKGVQRCPTKPYILSSVTRVWEYGPMACSLIISTHQKQTFSWFLLCYEAGSFLIIPAHLCHLCYWMGVFSRSLWTVTLPFLWRIRRSRLETLGQISLWKIFFYYMKQWLFFSNVVFLISNGRGKYH